MFKNRIMTTSVRKKNAFCPGKDYLGFSLLSLVVLDSVKKKAGISKHLTNLRIHCSQLFNNSTPRLFAAWPVRNVEIIQ